MCPTSEYMESMTKRGAAERTLSPPIEDIADESNDSEHSYASVAATETPSDGETFSLVFSFRRLCIRSDFFEYRGGEPGREALAAATHSPEAQLREVHADIAPSLGTSAHAHPHAAAFSRQP